MRKGTNGLIIRKGYIVAEFGDTEAVEPIYSAAKSFLSTILGLAVDRGLVKSVDDPVGRYVKDGGYDSAHNTKVTWRHHAQQTSEWEGEMWGKPHTFIGEAEFGEGKRNPRELREPGFYYEYNDVRMNRFALSLLRVWKRPLPEVLKTEVMDRIGATDSWKYLGYDNSYVKVDGRRIQSVSGGTRWGGGIWMSTRDLARFGLLILRTGMWNGKRILSEKWIREATTRGPVGPDYGYLWWLNSEGKTWPAAPKTSFAAIGHGSNTLWIDPEHDLVIAWRWHGGSMDEMTRLTLRSIAN
jgi:CubicO group peptidase (beta-lactamase class C family)